MWQRSNECDALENEKNPYKKIERERDKTDDVSNICLTWDLNFDVIKTDERSRQAK